MDLTTPPTDAEALFNDVPDGIQVDRALDELTLAWTENRQPHWLRRHTLNLLGFGTMAAVIGVMPMVAGETSVLACLASAGLFFGGAYVLGSADDLVGHSRELILDGLGFSLTRGDRQERVLWSDVDGISVVNGQIVLGTRSSLELFVADPAKRGWLASVLATHRPSSAAEGEVDPRLQALRGVSKREG
ncbi:MAG: hypothetical protein KC912_15655 [Proteobacteria bacterium]|nr:hypothetical protein [Pseudomonadota bacterium]